MNHPSVLNLKSCRVAIRAVALCFIHFMPLNITEPYIRVHHVSLQSASYAAKKATCKVPKGHRCDSATSLEIKAIRPLSLVVLH